MTMTKETEIKYLRELSEGDTYFAEYFASDIETMVQNIKNDHPIEMGCNFSMKADRLKAVVKKQQEEHKEALRNFAVAAYQSFGIAVPEPLNHAIMGFLGSRIEVIKAMSEAGVEIPQCDIDWLIEMAQK